MYSGGDEGLLDAAALGDANRNASLGSGSERPMGAGVVSDGLPPGVLHRLSLKPEEVWRDGDGRRSFRRMAVPRLRKPSAPHSDPAGDAASHADPYCAETPGAHSNGTTTAGGLLDAGVVRGLHRYSLKHEDVAWRSGDPRRIAFTRAAAQRQRRPAPPQKSYSQYNLNNLSTSTAEGSGQHTGKHMHGIYGLLARHIDVPQRVWDARVAAATTLGRRSIFGLPLLHPYSGVAVAWRCAMLAFDLVFTAFWVPLNVGFCYTSYGRLAAPCTRSDLAGGIVYVINWVLGFQMGAVLACGSRRAVALDGPTMAYVYVWHGKFPMDLLASIPFFVLLSAIASPLASSGHARRLMSLLSLIRLVRMWRLLNTVKVVYQDSLSGHYRISWITQRVSVYVMYLLILSYQFAVVVNLATSLMILLAAYYEYDTTWYDSMPWVSLREVSPPELWYHAAYWVLTVLTTTGQGQAPRRLGEQIVSNFCSVYGMVFNGLVVGVVGRALMQASGDASAMYLSRKKVGLVSHWARLRHLSLSLVKELQIYFADAELQRRDTHTLEASVIEGLPSTLRRTVVRHIVRPYVDKVHILSSAEPELKDMLAAMFRPLLVPPGHDLCRQGEPADRLWLVERGTVVALRHKEAAAHPTTGMACLLGEGVLLRGLMDAAAMRPWTLRTTSVCKLWELHWEDLEPLLRVYPRLISITLHYVHVRLIRMLVDEAQHDSAWCELLVVLGRILKQPALLDAARDNLEALVKAREEDSSLPLLLATWLEGGIATSLELGGGGRKQGLVTMSMMMARRSRDQLSSPSFASPFGSGGISLAAPSANFLSRYGGASGVGRPSTSFAQRGGPASLRAPSVGLAAAAPLPLASAVPSPAVLPRVHSSGHPGADGTSGEAAIQAASPLPIGNFSTLTHAASAASTTAMRGEEAPGTMARWGSGAQPPAAVATSGTRAASLTLQRPENARWPALPNDSRPGDATAAALLSAFAMAAAKAADGPADAAATASEADDGFGALVETRSLPLPRVHLANPVLAVGGGRAPGNPSRLAVATHASRRPRPSDRLSASAADSSAATAAADTRVAADAEVREHGSSNRHSFSDDSGASARSGGRNPTSPSSQRARVFSAEPLRPSPPARRPVGVWAEDSQTAVALPPPPPPPPLPLRFGVSTASAAGGLPRGHARSASWGSQAHVASAQGQSRDRCELETRTGPGPVAESGGAPSHADPNPSSPNGSPSQRAESFSAIAHTPRAYRLVDAGGSPMLPRPPTRMAIVDTVIGASAAPPDVLARSNTGGLERLAARNGQLGVGAPAAWQQRRSVTHLPGQGRGQRWPEGGGAGGASLHAYGAAPYAQVTVEKEAMASGMVRLDPGSPRALMSAADTAAVAMANTGSDDVARICFDVSDNPGPCTSRAGVAAVAGGAAAGGPGGARGDGPSHATRFMLQRGISRSFSAGGASNLPAEAFAAADVAADAAATAMPAALCSNRRRRSSVGSYTGAGSPLRPAGAAGSGGGVGSYADRGSAVNLLPARVSALLGRARTLPRGQLAGGGEPPTTTAEGASDGGPTDATAGPGAGACGAAAVCPTCGKCTCKVCRDRALSAAHAVERGIAVLAPPRGAAPPVAVAAAPPGAQAPVLQLGTAAAVRLVKRPSLDLGPGAIVGPGTVAAAALAAAGASGPGRPAVAPWARAAAAAAASSASAGGRGPETWRRRRLSQVMDLGVPSVPLSPYM